MYGAVTKPAIKADLENMHRVGLRGTYLMPIRGVDERPEYGGTAQQLTPAFWEMVAYASHIADSLGLELGAHICDGFALAGGPWFTPEESMQKIVYTSDFVTVKKKHQLITLPLAADNTPAYRDIAVYAIPLATDLTATATADLSATATVKPVDMKLSPTATTDDKTLVKASEPCWFTFDFGTAQNIRSIVIEPSGTSMQCQRMTIDVSNDGEHFTPYYIMQPPRQGWQNYLTETTYALPDRGAYRYYRFSWTPDGTEPGSEDLDAAKWKPTLRVKGIRFHTLPRIHQYEGKAAYAWRVAEATTDEQIPAAQCAKLSDIRRLSLTADGTAVTGDLPRGTYCILRMGHASTGMTNATAGGAKGLECDKFSKAAVNKLIDNWFCKFKEVAQESSALRYFHVDSWECGCQNWTTEFAAEFQKRRGYDLMPWLPVMAGVPVESAAESERVLRDVRLTINDLINDVFYATVRERAHEMGMLFSSEAIAPTMVADGMDHYQYSDLPMGEYWLNSPTHDKPNDMFDAISGAHIYGKPIVQAEGFTEVRGVWDETPASIKTLLDRNYALGMNRLFFHVNTHNPWMDRRPGMTLDGIGLFFQRDQIWMPEARPFVDYITRCQALLQQGRPVQDIAVYTGDEMPRRSVLPERLVPMLPGIFGSERVASEQRRLANEGLPMAESPVGVNHFAGIVDTRDWINPLHGYQYDSLNPDVLLNHATARDGRMVLDGGAQYRVLVVPGRRPMNPQAIASAAADKKIEELRKAGVVVIDKPYTAGDFSQYGLQRDVTLSPAAACAANCTAATSDCTAAVAYTHRTAPQGEIYFLSNQADSTITFRAAFRDMAAATPYIYNAVTNELTAAANAEGNVTITIPACGSCFVLFPSDGIDAMTACLPEAPTMLAAQLSPAMCCAKTSAPKGKRTAKASAAKPCQPVNVTGPYTLSLREADKTVTMPELKSWSELDDDTLRYFSGHGRYTATVTLKAKPQGSERLVLGEIHDIAHVWVNGEDCGIAWTAPYQLTIGPALRRGKNIIEIEVVNTWANAIRGLDEGKAPYPGIWTNAKYRMKSPHLLPAGLIGPLQILP